MCFPSPTVHNSVHHGCGMFIYKPICLCDCYVHTSCIACLLGINHLSNSLLDHTRDRLVPFIHIRS